MLETASNTSEDIKSIFVTQSARAPVDVASKIAFPAMSKTMRRHRRLVAPPMPNTLEDLGNICRDNPLYGKIDGTNFCWGTVGEEDSTSVLFLAEDLMQLLSESKEIHIDGTFKTRPRHPASSQLLTIMAVQYGYAFPCAYALMKSRKSSAYDQIFQKLREILPNMKVKFIMTDFEKPLVSSLERQFPNVNKAGCFFHYAQAILRKACGLGLKPLLRDNRLAKRSLKILICLALLPTNQIQQGFQYVSNFIAENHLSNSFETLLTYYRRQWLTRVGADGFSVYKRSRRTNNDSESFHALLQRLLRVRGANVWEFIGKIREISMLTVREVRAFIDEGLQIKVLPKRSYQSNSRRIRNLTSQFDEDGDVESFLNGVSSTMERIFQNVVADDETINMEEEILLTALPGDVPPMFEINDNSTTTDSEEEVVEVEEEARPDSNNENALNPIGERYNALCLICHNAPPTTIIMPCRHFGMCTECAETMQNMDATPQVPDELWGHTYNYAICPLDRQPIEQYITVIST